MNGKDVLKSVGDQARSLADVVLMTGAAVVAVGAVVGLMDTAIQGAHCVGNGHGPLDWLGEGCAPVHAQQYQGGDEQGR